MTSTATPNPLSQKDPRWRNVKVGNTPYTVGQIGCTITSMAMFSAKDPAWLARNLEFNQNGAILWESVKKTGDLNWVWRQYASPKNRVLEGLQNGEAVIVEIGAGNSYGGKHWLAIKSADDTGLNVIDPDMNPNTGVERYLGWGSVTGSSHFQFIKINNMSKEPAKSQIQASKSSYLYAERKNRLTTIIDAGDWESFAWEFGQAVNYIDTLEKKLDEAPEAAVLEQLQTKDEAIKQLEQDLSHAREKVDLQEASIINLKETVKDLEVSKAIVSAEELSELTAKKLEARLASKAQNLDKYIENNLPRWKRTLFDSLQILLPTIGAILVVFGVAEGSLLTGDLASPDSWVAIIGAVSTLLGVKQIDDKNKRKIAEELAKLSK